MLAYIRAHLDNPDLSHTQVAAAHHMAPRTLSRLFEGEPVSVSAYTRAYRAEFGLTPSQARRTLLAATG